MTTTSRSLADKLQFLFRTVRRWNRPEGSKDAREYSNAEVGAATGLSGAYIGQLRNGKKDNPSIETVQALANFFGVRQSYLLNDELDEDRLRSVEAQVSLFQALQNPGIRTLALRAAAADLSQVGLDAVTAMVEEVRQREESSVAPNPGKSRTSTTQE